MFPADPRDQLPATDPHAGGSGITAPTDRAYEPISDSHPVSVHQASDSAGTVAATGPNFTAVRESSWVPPPGGGLDADRPLAMRPATSPRRRWKVAAVGLGGCLLGGALTAVAPKLISLPLAETWTQLTDRMVALASPRLPIPTSRLIVQSSQGLPGEPTPLGVALQGQAEGAVVIIRGVLPGMDLSAGKAIDATTWWVSASDLDYAWIAPPPSFVGSADLIAELRLHNGKIADQQAIHLKWLPTISQGSANPPLDQQENLQADRQKTQTSSSIAPKRPEQTRPLKELQSSSLPGQGGLKEGSTDARATSSVRTLQG